MSEENNRENGMDYDQQEKTNGTPDENINENIKIEDDRFEHSDHSDGEERKEWEEKTAEAVETVETPETDEADDGFDNGRHTQILERVREEKKRRQERQKWRKFALAAGAVIVLVGGMATASYLSSNKSEQTAQTGRSAKADKEAEEARAAEESKKAEEEAKAREEEKKAKQEVVDSYTNLGLVQVSGYLNVRRNPGQDADIIGKLQENSACEIVGTEGEWYHITSGEVDGYVHSQYILTGEEAKQKAVEYVTKMAIINTEDDSLNIRSTPDSSSYENVVGQALKDERYPVIGETDGWVQIKEGYVSADYVIVKYALNEARKMDMREMVLNQYDNIVISKVDNYLNIRSEPTTDPGNGNVIGKMTSRAAGEILETLDGWYKIKSGQITGYISADPQYVAVGEEAKDLALESASLMAIVNTDKLNVRSEPSTDSKIWTQISKEERYNVVSQLDGWVQIELDGGDSEEGGSDDRAYISTRDNNVDVRYALSEAIKFSPLEEKSNEQASVRTQTVNYALKFVGGRYVWGGTNPNTGADCSGFVQYVMRNVAGVSLPRTSREQAKTGTSIKSSEMRPGDLIFYANKSGTVNHVAMYIGNGQIVHAASRRSGIKISTWNYRTPKTIRRVLP